MCILLNVKKHEKTFALNVDISIFAGLIKKQFTTNAYYAILHKCGFAHVR